MADDPKKIKDFIMKTNIQSEKFYKEANDMSLGWGDYLREVDKIEDKIQNEEPISLTEARAALWGKIPINSGMCKKFEKYAKNNKLDNLTWKKWKTCFFKWRNNYSDSDRK
jgi:hypothetical protein